MLIGGEPHRPYERPPLSKGYLAGSAIAADAVLVGVGAAPNVQLAEAAGLAVEHGVLVDAGLRTSDPDIFAVGDLVEAEHPLLAAASASRTGPAP